MIKIFGIIILNQWELTHRETLARMSGHYAGIEELSAALGLSSARASNLVKPKMSMVKDEEPKK